MKNRKTLSVAASIGTSATPYPNADAVLAVVHAGFEPLSRQLKTIARYVEKHRDQLALDGVQATAAQCGVQPSALVMRGETVAHDQLVRGLRLAAIAC